MAFSSITFNFSIMKWPENPIYLRKLVLKLELVGTHCKLWGCAIFQLIYEAIHPFWQNWPFRFVSFCPPKLLLFSFVFASKVIFVVKRHVFAGHFADKYLEFSSRQMVQEWNATTRLRDLPCDKKLVRFALPSRLALLHFRTRVTNQYFRDS